MDDPLKILLHELARPADKGTTRARKSIYVDEKVYKDFQAVCREVGRPSSVVLERLMAMFVAASREPTK